jgi:hypothetical protein
LKKKALSLAQRHALVTAISGGSRPSVTSLRSLIKKKTVPARLKWQPDLCLRRGKENLLIHVLVAPEFPSYIEAVLRQLKNGRYKNTYVLLLARDIATEAGDDSPPVRMAAPVVALKVAEKALCSGCALAFESEGRVHPVFEKGYHPPARGRCGEETGHISKWLYGAVANASAFSPHLSRAFKAFGGEYARATRRKSITNEREADLVLKFAKRVARGEPRLFFPLGHLQVLREYEMAKANKRTRDHFFHTFNNLFLGFHILGSLYRGKKYIADVDRSIEDSSGVAKLHPWESLWFLTCVFHDPAYIAENFWGTVRFSYGVEQDEASDDEELPDSVKRKIRDMWDSKFVGPRQDLHDLYNRTVKRWVPPTIRKTGAETFDAALQKAYFDGRATSHSLVSGLRLINLCRTQNVPRDKIYDPDLALTACEIAALSMMFHDPRCRAILTSQGIPPIAFERLPYASLLMFVDALQDDRRDISISRFRERGVLKAVRMPPDGTAVEAEVRLQELPVRGWAPRMAEYESVMAWVNSESEIQFRIDYRTEAGL